MLDMLGFNDENLRKEFYATKIGAIDKVIPDVDRAAKIT